MFYRDGSDFEKKIFDEPDEIILDSLAFFQLRSFEEDVGGVIKSIPRSKSYKRFPKTPVARSLYFGVKRHLKGLGINAKGLRLFSFLGTDVDRYYGTDALFYLPPSCGYECVVTIDAYLVNPILLSLMRDYWADSSEGCVYSEAMFQRDLFAHKRMFSEHFDSDEPMFWWNPWVLSSEYKQLWERGYIPAVPDEMIARPMMRPENHLLLTSHHLEQKWRREAFTRLVAVELYKQIFSENKSIEEKSLLTI